MTYQERTQNFLKLADDALDTYKSKTHYEDNDEARENVALSVGVFLGRAICNALLDIAVAIREGHREY